MFDGKDTPGEELAVTDGSFALKSDENALIAAKKDIKLRLNGTVAVRLRCAPRGKGYFAPLRAKRGGPPIPGAGSKNFPSLTAMPI